MRNYNIKSLLLTFSFLLLSLAAFAQAQVNVTGRVLNASNKTPLEFTTVIFVDANNEMVNGGITDMNGEYNIRVAAGTYTIRYEFMSFETFELKNQTISPNNSRIQDVSLKQDSNVLDAVEIRAETTEVQINLDKKVYNIGKDLTTSGATISDVLDNVPSVSVDVEGAISLRGNENVRILINGRPSALAGFDSTEALQQLPAEAIERVEVITSPSARYDAEGTAGILNIILRQESTLGINGSVRVHAGDPKNAGISTNLNIRTSKFNIFNSSGFNYRTSKGKNYSKNQYLDETRERPYANEFGKSQRWGRGFNTNLGMEYFINDQSSIVVSGFGRFGNMTNRSGNITEEYDEALIQQIERSRTDEKKNRNNNLQLSVNYDNRLDEEGQKLTADFQIDRSKRDGRSFIEEYNTLPSHVVLPGEYNSDLRTRTGILGQIDYVLPMGTKQFEVGYRADLSDSKTDYVVEEEVGNSGDYVNNPDLSNIFDYTQDTHALYTQYGDRFGSFSVLLGLRLEATKLKGKIDGDTENTSIDFSLYDFNKDYVELFPTANITYEFDETQNITLGYNRRINRPGHWYINPFPSRSSESNIFQGNPSLDPAFSNTFDLGYLKTFDRTLTLNASVYFQKEDDSFEVISEDTGQLTSNGIPIIRAIPINLSTEKRYGAEASIMYNATKWLRLNGSFNYYKYDKSGEYNGRDYGAKDDSWFSRFSAKVTLPAKIDWQTNMFYRGPSRNAQTKSDGMASVDMALSKEVFKGNGTIGFNVRDLFDTRKRKSFTSTDTFIKDSEFRWMSRSVNFSITYRFNQSQQDMQRNNRRNRMNGNDFDEGGMEGGF